MKPDEKTPLKTLASCVNGLQKDGFKENFMVDEKGLHTSESEKYYGPSDVKIVNFYRFEGESDPGDNSILYAVETNDGLKGMLTDAYGAYADPHMTKFITEVEDIMKKTNREQKL